MSRRKGRAAAFDESLGVIVELLSAGMERRREGVAFSFICARRWRGGARQEARLKTRRHGKAFARQSDSLGVQGSSFSCFEESDKIKKKKYDGMIDNIDKNRH
ncbi:hypothetical protein [Mailhella sp.]|uniref:hypothetical protein n=1 Tax=Mailhella sp. TaxID=1981029 RepID=UPI003AB49323